MRILKVFYIIWVIFWALGWILAGALAYDHSQALGNSYPSNEILKAMFVFLMFCLYPLLPYFYYLIYEKATKTKRILIATCCYIFVFIIICCYILAFIIFFVKNDNNAIMWYCIGVIIHIFTFITIYANKRSLLK